MTIFRADPAGPATVLPHSALAQAQQVVDLLKAANLQWFDDNPYASVGPYDLKYAGAANAFTAWDEVSFLGDRFTFIGQVKGKFGIKLDVKDKVGKNGAALTDMGAKVKDQPISITLYLLTPAYLLDYQRMLREIFNVSNSANPGGSEVMAVDVSHPSLAIHNLTSLYLYEVDLITPPRAGNPAHVVLHFHHFMVPPPHQNKTSTVKRGKPNGGAHAPKPKPAPPPSATCCCPPNGTVSQ